MVWLLVDLLAKDIKNFELLIMNESLVFYRKGRKEKTQGAVF
jgi:hypothetical protein